MDFSVGVMEKLRYKHIVFALGVIAFFALFCLLMVPFLVFAAGPPYQPGETLNPDCLPTDPTCIVVAPPAGTGSAGTLTYWLATSTVSSTPLLFWDDSNLRLGIGTSTAVANALFTVATTSNIFTVLSNGSVGIGTTAPSSTLHVIGNAIVSATSTFLGNMMIGTSTQASSTALFTIATTSNIFTVLDNGNVGIGTAVPGYKLEVNGQARIVSDLYLASAGKIETGSVGLSGINGIGITPAANYGLSLGSNNINARLIIGLNGNVGIGTTAPYSLLNVAGLPPQTSTSSLVLLGSNFITGGSASGTFLAANPTSTFNGDFINFQVNSTTQFKVASSGALTLRGDILFNSAALKTFEINAGNLAPSGGAGNNLTVKGGDACCGAPLAGGNLFLYGGLGIYGGVTGNTILAYTGSSSQGNVGIGTGSPLSLLQVAGFPAQTTTSSLVLLGSNFITGGSASGTFLGANPTSTNNFGDFINFQVGSSTKFLVNSSGSLTVATGTPAANALFTIATTSNIFTVLSNGSVGIGTTNPTTTLEVVGVVSSTGMLFVNATGTNITITGLASTSQLRAASTTITGLTFANATGTGWLTVANASATGLWFVNATGTNLTITGIVSSTQFRAASSSLNGLTFVNATSTGWLTVGNASATNLWFVNATGTGNLRAGTLNIGTSTPASSTALLTIATGTNIFTVGNRGVVLINATSGIYNSSLPMATSSLIVCGRTSCVIPNTASTTNAVAIFASPDGTTTSNSIVARGSIVSGQSDIGEYINVVGAESDYEAGDILSVSSAEPGKFEKSSTAYDTKLAGVITETAGLIAGGGENNHGSRVIGLQGRLPVKVTGANGPIAVGDYLTSSDVPGYAQKAAAAGRVVAIAMETFNGATSADKGKILAFIEKSYYPGANIASLSSAPVGESLQSGSAGVGSALNTYTFDPNMVYSFENLKAQNFEVGSSVKPSGITIYDTQTKNPYCIIMENGVLKSVPGKCGEGATTGIISAPSFTPAANASTNSTVTAVTSTSEIASPPADGASTAPSPDSVNSSSTTVQAEGPLDTETSVTEAAATVDATSTDSATASDVSGADASGAATTITPETTSVVTSTADASAPTSTEATGGGQ